MPINTKHELYENMLPLQDKCRIVCEGEDAVKAAGAKFLPMLGGQKPDEYEAYKTRALFFNASGRTVEGLTGVVFRKPPSIETPDEELLKNTTNAGDDMDVFLRHATRELIMVGRLGLLGDIKDDATQPHIAVYNAESVINWRTEMINGEQKLILLVLEEKVKEYTDDPFEPEEVTQYRVLVLTDRTPEDFEALGEGAEFDLTPSINRENGINAFLAVAVYREKEKETTSKGAPVFELVEGPYFPTIRGKRIDHIPFVAVNPTHLSIDRIDNPPILDVANVNLGHYRGTADHKHGLHFSALPTAWVAGFKTDQVLRIGSATAWISDDPQAHASFLEFTGAGLGAIRDDLKDMQEQMAILGSRMLEEPKRQVEAADTHAARKAGEESVIGSIVSNLESAVEKILRWFAEWQANNPEDVSVSLNKDYMAKVMEPGMLTALMGALQQSRISYNTFFYNLQQGEIMPDGRTIEEELQLIEENPPVPPMTAGMGLEGEEEEEPEEEEEEEEEEN